MKNIHVLPTEKPSRVRIGNNGNFVIGLAQNATVSKNDSYTNQNIYITSDEEIKYGDYVYNTKYNNVRKYFLKVGTITSLQQEDKKIILTTDQDLIKDGIQAIPDEFLEWFVKNPNCEEVEVEINSYMDKNISDSITFTDYKIIIPKEEPKQDWYCPKCQSYVSSESVTFEETHQLCNTSVIIAEPKQKTTLEEAAERYANMHQDVSEELGTYLVKAVFQDGAKWQQKPEQFFNDDRVKTLEKSMEYLLKKQERSYSEEEVELIANEMVNWAIDNVGNPNPQSGKKFDEVLNKFKKNKI